MARAASAWPCGTVLMPLRMRLGDEGGVVDGEGDHPEAEGVVGDGGGGVGVGQMDLQRVERPKAQKKTISVSGVLRIRVT